MPWFWTTPWAAFMGAAAFHEFSKGAPIAAWLEISAIVLVTLTRLFQDREETKSKKETH